MKYLREMAPAMHADVVVVGAGSAGATAAIAASRAGASTLLLERYGFLGGTSTAVLDTFYGFYTPGQTAHKVVGGVADEVVGGLRALNNVIERPNTYGAGIGITYSPDLLKCVWDRLVLEAGVRVQLNSWVQDVTVEDGRITSVVLATRSGFQLITGDIFVDATGDADLCHWAGVPLETAGQHEDAQSLTTTFRLCNVDVEARKRVGTKKLHELMREAGGEGYSLPRKEGSDHITPVAGMVATNMTRVASFQRTDAGVVNATDPALLTAAEIDGRAQSLEYLRFLRDKVDGYQNAALCAFSTQIGVRETRRLLGEYVLTREDVLGARQFEDQIGLCGAPIEEHGPGEATQWAYLPEGQCVGIPYRTLLPRTIDNLLVAGRCFSATHDAHASVRSMAQCMAMGQAAGTAAALSWKAGILPRNLSPQLLRGVLIENGAVLSVPEAVPCHS